MKYFILSLFSFLLVTSSVFSQEFKIQATNSRDGSLALEDFTEELPIEGYSGNEIVITGVSGQFTAPERAKGLKPVYEGGTDNTGLAIAMEKNGNKITLRCLLGVTRNAKYKIRVPDNFSLKITRDCARGATTNIQNIKNEIEFKGCHDIDLKNVTGPLVISTISGNVNVKFSEISKDKPISIASISGEVDVTLPAKAAVNLNMHSVSGGMFSDFDFPNETKDMKKIGGNKIDVQLNGGGTDLKLSSVSGNIYLRKG